MSRLRPGVQQVTFLLVCFNAIAIPLLFWQQSSFRSERVKNTRTLVQRSCEADSRQNLVLAGLVEAAIADEPDSGSNRRFRVKAREALVALRPIDCSLVPTE